LLIKTLKRNIKDTKIFLLYLIIRLSKVSNDLEFHVHKSVKSKLANDIKSSHTLINGNDIRFVVVIIRKRVVIAGINGNKNLKIFDLFLKE